MINLLHFLHIRRLNLNFSYIETNLSLSHAFRDKNKYLPLIQH